MKKVGEMGFYDIYESGWWIFKRTWYQINYSRIPWDKVSEDYKKVMND